MLNRVSEGTERGCPACQLGSLVTVDSDDHVGVKNEDQIQVVREQMEIFGAVKEIVQTPTGVDNGICLLFNDGHFCATAFESTADARQ